LVGAGLCIRSLRNLQKVDPGFEPSELALMSFDLGLNRYDPPRGREFYNELLERVRAFPGVEAAGLALNTPLSGRSPAMSVERLEDYQPGPREHAFADLNIVSPGYFGAMGIPLLQGRDFSSHDTENSAKVVIINEAFGERYWPGQNPLGKRLFQHGPNGGIATEVIGVVRTTNNRRLTDKPRQMFYFPLAQKSELALTLAVRSGVEAATTIHRVRDLVKSLDGQAPVFGVRTMSEQRDASLGLQRMAAVLLTGFGGLALLLAALGIYAVLAYSVRCRTREIGVRMALGAQLADVLNLVMRQGVRLALLGLGLGLAGALGASRLIRSFLFEVKPIDPTTFLGVTILLGAVALAACWLPARQAAKTDPMEALRHD